MSVLPTKLLQGSNLSFIDEAYWSDSVSGPWDGFPYKWRATLVVNSQAHGSPDTPTPYFYTGEDVKVGDWITDGTVTVQIVEIISQDSSNLVVIYEDIERYNTFNDPYQVGSGSISTGNIIIYELSAAGVPILRGLPAGLFPDTFSSAIQGRFAERNPVDNFVTVLQTNHGFVIGDFIKVDNENAGRFKLCSNSEVNLAIGVITGIGASGFDSFTFKPLGELVENVDPPLIGGYGDIFYIDPANPGKVTNVQPEHNVKPIYVRLDSDTRAILLNISVDENTVPVQLKVIPTLDQTTFTMPPEADSVVEMSINGIETSAFVFDTITKVLTFDPVANGYGLDSSDEVIFIYLS